MTTTQNVFKFKPGDLIQGTDPAFQGRVIAAGEGSGIGRFYKMFWLGERDNMQFLLFEAEVLEEFYELASASKGSGQYPCTDRLPWVDPDTGETHATAKIDCSKCANCQTEIALARFTGEEHG